MSFNQVAHSKPEKSRTNQSQIKVENNKNKNKTKKFKSAASAQKSKVPEDDLRNGKKGIIMETDEEYSNSEDGNTTFKAGQTQEGETWQDWQ